MSGRAGERAAANRRLMGLVERLVRGEQLEAALRDCGMMPAQALRILQSAAAIKMMKRMRELAAVQKRLMLEAAEPGAVEILRRQMENGEKPEVQLKGALSVLALAKEAARKRKREAKDETACAEVVVSDEEVAAAMAAVAERRAAKRREAFAS